MKIRTLISVSTVAAALFVACAIGAAEKPDSNQTQTAATKEAPSEFLQRWKKIHYALKKHAYEIQQTRTASGVRGSDFQEEPVLDMLYGTASRYPGNQAIKNAIKQLREIIKAAPKAEAVPEYKLWIALCYDQLGNTKKASDAYRELIEQHPDTEHAARARVALGKKNTSNADSSDVEK